MVPGLWLSEGGQSVTGKLVRVNIMLFQPIRNKDKTRCHLTGVLFPVFGTVSMFFMFEF